MSDDAQGVMEVFFNKRCMMFRYIPRIFILSLIIPTLVGSEDIPISTVTGAQRSPGLGWNRISYLVVWRDDGPGGHWGQLISEDGVPILSGSHNTAENDENRWGVMGGIGLSRYRLSQEFGISGGVGVDWRFKPNVALRVSGRYDYTERNLYYPITIPIYPPYMEKVHAYSLEIIGAFYSRSTVHTNLELFFGIGPSLHYYDLFRTRTFYVGDIFPEGKDSDLRVTLGLLFGFKLGVMRGPLSLGFELSLVEDFKDRWSRRSIGLRPTIYWR